MKKFTVLGFYEDSGQLYCDHFEGDNTDTVLSQLADNLPDLMVVAVLPGHLQEPDDIVFPGSHIAPAGDWL